jgi:hypothetical protein
MLDRDTGCGRFDKEPAPEMLLTNKQMYAEYLNNCLCNLSVSFENIFKAYNLTTRGEYENLPHSTRYLELLKYATIYATIEG